MPMNIVNDYPPNHDLICDAIEGVRGNESIVFTYGDTVYHPSGGELAEHVKQHERVHIQQQTKMDKDEWWAEYLKNPQFRLEQELAAYRVQFKYIQRGRNWRNTESLLSAISKDLSGDMYGNILSYQEARAAISKK